MASRRPAIFRDAAANAVWIDFHWRLRFFFLPQICRWRSCRDVLNCSYIFCIFFTFFQKNFLVPFFVKVLKNTFKKLSSMSAEEILEAAVSVEQLKRKP